MTGQSEEPERNRISEELARLYDKTRVPASSQTITRKPISPFEYRNPGVVADIRSIAICSAAVSLLVLVFQHGPDLVQDISKGITSQMQSLSRF
jgi:hypothetical protein